VRVDAKLKRDKKREWGTITGVGKTKRGKYMVLYIYLQPNPISILSRTNRSTEAAALHIPAHTESAGLGDT
jgi:hypothetical protein